METAFGHDFSSVRLERTPPASLGEADAETRGARIRFATSAPGLESSEGQELLAHELTHLVQQRAGRTRGLAATAPGIAPHAGLETEAERTATRVASGLPAPSSVREASPTVMAPSTGLAQPGRGKKSKARQEQQQERMRTTRPATERLRERLTQKETEPRTTNRPALSGRTVTVYRAEEAQYARFNVQDGRVQVTAPHTGALGDYKRHTARNERQAELNRVGVRNLGPKGYDQGLLDDPEYAQLQSREFLRGSKVNPNVRALYAGFGDPSRAVAFYRQRMQEDPTKDMRIRSFQIPTGVFNELQRKSVLESQATSMPTRPHNVDVQHGRNQYGLRSHHIALLNKFAIPGTALEEDPQALERLHGSGQSRYDEQEAEGPSPGSRSRRRPYRPTSGGKGGRRGGGPVRAQFQGGNTSRGDPLEEEGPLDAEAAQYMVGPGGLPPLTLADFIPPGGIPVANRRRRRK